MSAIHPIYVSCDAQKLYDAASFPGPEAERLLINDGTAAGMFVCELFGSYKYLRPIELDNLKCSEDFRQTLERARTLVNSGPSGPASGLFLLPQVIIRDRVIYIDDGQVYPVLYETHRPIDRANSSLAAREDLENAIPCAFEGGVNFFLGSTGCFNYGHWLVDDLTRLKAFWKIRALHPDERINIIVAGHFSSIDRVKQQSIEALLHNDKNFKIYIVSRPASISVQRLYFASPTTVHSTLKSPNAMHDFRAAAIENINELNDHKLLPAAHGEPISDRYLFIDRGPARSRNLKNGLDIFSALQKRGFERHTLEDASFADQVSAFSRAKIVVGNMGAGMTNTVFCRAGTPVLNLAPEGWDEPFFWDLAAVMKHKHYALYGAIDGETFEDGYLIDPARVVEEVDRICL